MTTTTQVNQNRTINERASRIEWDLGKLEAYARVVVSSRRDNGALVVDEVDAEELIAEAVQQVWLHCPSEIDCPSDEDAQLWSIRASVVCVLSGHWLAGRVISRGRMHRREMVEWREDAPSPITMSEYKRFFRELDEYLRDVGLRLAVDRMSVGLTVHNDIVRRAKTALKGFCHDFATERRLGD